MKRMGCILVMAMALLVLAKPCVVMAQDASTLMRAQRNANNPNDPFNTAAGNGWDPKGGCLYYYNPKKTDDKWIRTRTVTTVIGNHHFAI